MEDKDLDKYFKDRSDSFNEAPGEGLWAKIEANIEPPAQGGFKAGKWLLPGAGVVVVAGLVAAWLAIRNTAETPIPAPQQQQEVTVITDSVVPVTDTKLTEPTTTPVARTTETKPAENEPVPQAPTPAIAVANADTVSVDEFAGGENAKPAATASQVPLYTHNVKSTGDTIAVPGKKSIPYYFDFDENKDAIEINIIQKISPAERNSLIQNTIKSNAPYVGRKIVIKAKGYRIYRHTITQSDYKIFETLKDSVKTKTNLKIEVLADTIYHNLNQDSLTPATIRFENKSAKKE